MRYIDIANVASKEELESIDATQYVVYRIVIDEGYEIKELLCGANKHGARVGMWSIYDYADDIIGDYGRRSKFAKEPIDIMKDFTSRIDSDLTNLRKEIDILTNEQKRAERIEELTRIADIVDYMQEEIGYKLQNSFNK